jgi:hypothetical protein
LLKYAKKGFEGNNAKKRGMVSRVLAEITVTGFCENGNKIFGPEIRARYQNLLSVE